MRPLPHPGLESKEACRSLWSLRWPACIFFPFEGAKPTEKMGWHGSLLGRVRYASLLFSSRLKAHHVDAEASGSFALVAWPRLPSFRCDGKNLNPGAVRWY